MISVSEALENIFALVSPLDAETVGLRAACGRTLAQDAVATRDQPPFAASAMDGYAVDSSEVRAGATFDVVGESAAGSRFDGALQPGQAVRIFTGAPLPDGTDHVIIQEDVVRENSRITLASAHDTQAYVRPAGGDFRAGDSMTAGRILSPADIALLASMNIPQIRVIRQPEVAIVATGDELVMPGETPNADQIVSSNGFGLAALLERAGARVRLMPIARDRIEALKLCLDLAATSDLVVTTGGASVGAHDLMSGAADELGLAREFYKVAMRPGKPLMAGRISGTPLIGLPGNPVSSMVCGTVFVVPAVRALAGMPPAPAARHSARLGHDIAPNARREHYMRAHVDGDVVTVFDRQDSSLQRVLSHANALVVRPIEDPARSKGESVYIIPL